MSRTAEGAVGRPDPSDQLHSEPDVQGHHEIHTQTPYPERLLVTRALGPNSIQVLTNYDRSFDMQIVFKLLDPPFPPSLHPPFTDFTFCKIPQLPFAGG